MKKLTKKPRVETWWMIKHPNGHLMISQVNYVRKNLKESMSYKYEMPWEELKNMGYKAVKVKVSEVVK